MLRTPNFGRKSLNEIKEVLSTMGLHLGMQVEGWPPENIDEQTIVAGGCSMALIREAASPAGWQKVVVNYETPYQAP
jgi:hypothetical protein